MVIALLSDFGAADIYAGVMKGVIAAANPGARVIDISHDVKPFSLVNAQYLLYASYRFFPKGTVFAVVVDPGVGTGRAVLLAQDERWSYLLPDNGIISAVYSPGMRIYAVDTTCLGEISPTFHGRDVFAPIAAALSKGESPESMAKPAGAVVRLPFPRYRHENNRVYGQVLHVDTYGNVITSIPAEGFPDHDHGAAVFLTTRVELVRCDTFGNIPGGMGGLYAGSSGFMEMALSEESFAKRYGVTIEQELRIEFI